MPLQRFLLVSVFLFAGLGVRAQTASSLQQLDELEKAMQPLANDIVNAPEFDQRLEACKKFIPQLVEALKIKGSFYYPFDSLRQISILYAPDSSFRIFTWGLAEEMGTYRYYGTLQMHTADNELKMFPFVDASAIIQNPDTVTSNKAWMGCIYYKILKNQKGNKVYYTLMGWEANNFRSNKKQLEILSFENGAPVLGAPVFNFSHDTTASGMKNRFIIEYKEDGNASMNYDPDNNMILYDHLVSINNQPQNKYTLVPDGTYEGFKWQNGSWVHIAKIFDEKSDKPPVPAPLQFKKNILEKDTAIDVP